jgi:hypothetical protein
VHEREIFLNEWQGGDLETLKRAFGISARELAGVEVLLAAYCRDSLGGAAFVLLRRAGVLYEVNASHDSAGSIAGQWEPEETLVEALQYRLDKGRLGCDEEGGSVFADELRFLLLELSVEASGRDF